MAYRRDGTPRPDVLDAEFRLPKKRAPKQKKKLLELKRRRGRPKKIPGKRGQYL